MLQLIGDQIIMVKEEGNEVLRTPECFGYHDQIDPSCARCKVKSVCIEEQIQHLPPCYSAQHDENAPECVVCILESQCIEAQYHKEGIKMPTIVLRKPATLKPVTPAQPAAEPESTNQVTSPELTAPAAKPALKLKTPAAKPAVAKVEEPAEEDLPDTFGLTDMPIEQLRAMATEFGLPTDGRKSVLVQRLLRSEDVVAALQTKEAQNESAPTPASVVEVGFTTSPDVLMELSMRLQEGQSLLLTPTDDGAVIVKAIGMVGTPVNVGEPAAPAAAGLRGDAYDKEVWTPEYYNFIRVDAGDGKPWEKHTTDEKSALAKSAGLTWQEHTDAKITAMNMFNAVIAALGVEKYKPEYKSKSARDAVRG